jgi:4-amino-4-deoxy-L-arabinose transferase-like glycosyltransferase
MIEGRVLDWRSWVLLALAALIILAPGISALPPVDRDESRYAVATTQMLQSRDFIDIRYQETPRHLQPAGIYWLQSTSVAAFSSPEAKEIWAFRLPSLLSAAAAALMTAWFAGALFGRQAAIGAGILLASCLSLNFEARIAKIDATLLAACTGALASLAHLYLDRARKTRLMAGAFWAALGFGLLLKGPIILIFALTCIVFVSVWDRDFTWLKRLHAGWGIILMLAIALPWYIAIARVDPNFFDVAIGGNLVRKVGESQQSHGGPIGYHLMLFAAMFWPGSLIALLAIPFVWRSRHEKRVRLLICWIVPGWIVFELISTKLPHYVLPTYPAIAALAGASLFLAPRGQKRARWLTWLGGTAIALWVLVTAGLSAMGPAALRLFEQRFDVISISLAVLGFGLALLGLFFLLRLRPMRALAALGASAFFNFANVYAYSAPRAEHLWPSPRIVAAVKDVRPCAQSRLISTPYHEPSLVFLYGPYDTILARSAEEAASALGADKTCNVAVIGHDREAEFLSAARKAGMSPRAIGKVDGRNYSDNARLDLTLYAAQ